MKLCLVLFAACLSAMAGFAQTGGSPSLDVVGIKPGMTVSDAMRALKAYNPNLNLRPMTFGIEGFPGDLLLEAEGVQAGVNAADGTLARGAETIEILFTQPPTTEVVWGVKRVYNFTPKEKPSLESALQALRRKYGPETIPASTDPRSPGGYMAWVYDAQGKPMGASGAELHKACNGVAQTHFGGDSATRNELLTGRQAEPAQCQSIIIVNANVNANRVNGNSSQYEVWNMSVEMTDTPRHRVALDATKAVVLGASKARQNKEAEEVKKRAAPKL
jgi:hypothetical protein